MAKKKKDKNVFIVWMETKSSGSLLMGWSTTKKHAEKFKSLHKDVVNYKLSIVSMEKNLWKKTFKDIYSHMEIMKHGKLFIVGQEYDIILDSPEQKSASLKNAFDIIDHVLNSVPSVQKEKRKFVELKKDVLKTIKNKGFDEWVAAKDSISSLWRDHSWLMCGIVVKEVHNNVVKISK